MSESTPGTVAQFPPLAGPPLLGLHEMELNFGPQHPSTHGVLRLVLKVDGERIVSARPDVGYLHRGTEKLFETETYPMVIPHTDRLDYVAAATNNHAYCLVVEKVLQEGKKVGTDRVLCTLRQGKAHCKITVRLTGRGQLKLTTSPLTEQSQGAS